MAVTINASTSSGLVQSADTSGEIELQSNGTTALKVNTNEGIQILNCLGVGNATPSTSGAGITFPATQSASSDANTLDDYEEGTWTPTVSFGNGTTGITYASQSGWYIKVGGQITIWAYVGLSNKGSSTGDARITGLPFTNANNAPRSEGATMTSNYWINMSGTPIVTGYVENNQTRIYLVNGSSTNNTPALTSTNFTNTSGIYLCATYSTV